MLSRNEIQNINLGIDFNFAIDNLFNTSDNPGTPTPPPPPNDFLLLDNTYFLLLNDGNLLLL